MFKKHDFEDNVFSKKHDFEEKLIFKSTILKENLFSSGARFQMREFFLKGGFCIKIFSS